MTHNKHILSGPVVLRDVADHLHEERIVVLEGVFHEEAQAVRLTDQLGTPLIGRQVDTEGNDLEVGLVVYGTQQHLHHLR